MPRLYAFRAILALACLLVPLAAVLPARPACAQVDPGAPDPVFGDEATAPSPDEQVDPFFDDDFEAGPAGFPDPAETSNRAIFAFNEALDRWFFDPLTKGYRFIFPDAVRRAIRRAFLNLGEPGTIANDLLQLEWTDAGAATARFTLNSTLGIGGLFDPAGAWGLPRHKSDFGQTLTLAGTPSGVYLVLPLFGPSNVRDGTGMVVDAVGQPITWFLGPVPMLIFSGSEGVSTREEHADEIEALRESSVDYYAALRNAYYQNRLAEIWERREDRRDDWVPAPDEQVASQ